MALPSSSSSFNYRFTYDVFLSFRGEDTRYGFTGHLYKTLRDKGIRTFIDDRELHKGDQITSALEKAIQESRIFIIVLSQNYASSSFCLNELAYILNFIKEKGLLVLPVFYDVDPSHVRHHTGNFGEALANHEKKFKATKEGFKDNMQKLEKWKKALREAANMSGYHFKHGRNGYEYEFIQEIIELVSSKLNRVPLSVAKYPVGLESQMLEVKSLLDVGSNDVVHMVGIHGLGGIGKTTLAVAVYNSIADHFEGLCFLENVRETSNKHGLQYLQSKLLSKVVGEKDINLISVREGIPIIQDRLQQKKVLLILDDVDKHEQLKAIFETPDWFGPGSRVIITTRDKQLLVAHDVERMYEVKGLNNEDAHQLLNWKAFKLEKIDPSFQDVLNQAVTYASGLPLALEVIGSNLSGKNIKVWKSALKGYKSNPHQRIQEILKVSYDDLEKVQQSIFLDIACCFNNCELAEVQYILDAHHGNCMKYNIEVLVDKSLIKIDVCGWVTLHDLIEDMGKEIVRKESLDDPGKRSRLWSPEDIVEVLEENKGSSQIEIIFWEFFLYKEVEWHGDAFKNMENLKTLIIRSGHFSRGPNHLPNTLRVLEWKGYPSEDLPCNFHPKKLAICTLRESCFTSLGLAALFSKKKIVNLTSLDFSDHVYLTHIPDLSCLSHLEKLSFYGCKNLDTIHSSVGFLEKLKILVASSCFKLKSFPPLKLISLEQFELNFCGSLESFPEILGKMENITELSFPGTPIKKFPLSFRNLTRLRKLQLDHSSGQGMSCCDAAFFIQIISMMPELVKIKASGWEGCVLPKEDGGAEKVSLTVSSNLQRLHLEHCNLSDDFFPTFLPYFANVKELDLSWNNFTDIPECIKEFRFLARLNLDHCKHLQEIRRIPPNLKHFSAKDCVSLTSACRSMLLNQELHEAGNTILYLPLSKIPKWFECRTRGSSISFWFRNKFPAVAICLVVGPVNMDSHPDFSGRVTYTCRPDVIINGNRQECDEVYSQTDCTCLFDSREVKLEDNLYEAVLENEWNHVEFVCEDLEHAIFIKWGIHVLKHQSSMEDIRFTNPCDEGKLDDDFSDSESQNQPLGEMQRLMNMEVAETQFVQQQQPMGDLSRMWKWALVFFHFLLLQQSIIV